MRISILVLFVLLAGCTSIQVGSTSKPEESEKVVDDVTFTRLFPVNEWGDLNIGLEKDEFISKKAQATLISQKCNLSLPEKYSSESALAAVTATIVSAGIKQLVGAIDKKIEEELKKYSSEYEAKSYVDAIPDKKCWRMVRAVREEKGKQVKETVLFDALFALDIMDSSLTPVRAVLVKPAPKKKSASDKYGIALSLEVKTANNLGELVASEDIVFKADFIHPKDSEPTVHYFNLPKYCEKEDSKNTILYCSKTSNKQYFANIKAGKPAEMKVTVAEVGAAPKLLTYINKIFSATSEDIGGILADAAEAKINPEDE